MTTHLITGANRGIGLCLARSLIDAGHEVLACARNPAQLSDLPAESFELDLADDASIARLADTLAGRPIDVLINNAGILIDADDRHGPSFGKLQRDQLIASMEINAVAPLLLTQALHPMLAAGERKLIANMSSELGSIAGTRSAEPYAYRASKAALNMITRSLSCDPKLKDFTVVAVHPGWVRTDMGGPKAPLTPSESAASLRVLIESLDRRSNGALVDRNGAPIPW